MYEQGESKNHRKRKRENVKNAFHAQHVLIKVNSRINQTAVIAAFNNGMLVCP